RRDLWWNVLMTLARGLFSFHPLVWLAEKEARLAQEVACDAVALRVTAAPVAEYGEALPRVAMASSARSLCGPVAVGVVESYASLKRRIVAMVRPGSTPNRGVVRLGP